MENSELPEKINKLREGCDRLRRRSGERLSATGLMVQLVMLETTPRKDTRERILEVAESAVLAFAATSIGNSATAPGHAGRRAIAPDDQDHWKIVDDWRYLDERLERSRPMPLDDLLACPPTR